MIRNNVYTVNPIMARAESNKSTQTPTSSPVSNMSVTEKAVLSATQASIQPNQLAYSFVSVDEGTLAASTTTSTLPIIYEAPLNVSVSGSSLLFKLIQDETQMFVSKAQVEEWTAKADGDHKHSGNDITTGTIPPEVLNNIPINKIIGLENELSYLRNVTLNSYTKSEMDVKLLDIQTSLASTLEDMIGDLDNPIWKNPVGTFADIATAYPTPDPGWVATTIDTSIAYLYTGTQWVPIASTGIPMASHTEAGLMSIDDKVRLDELISGGGSDGAATTLGGFTEDYFLNRSSEAQTKAGDLTVNNLYSTGAVVAHMTANYTGLTEPIAGTTMLGFVKVDGTTILIDPDGTLHAIGSGAGSWGELSGKPEDLVAIAALSGTAGLLKKTGVGVWALDTTVYGSSTADITGVTLDASLLTLTRAAGDLTASIPIWNQSTTGSAATLTTPRAINVSVSGVNGTAQDFNGSIPITIPVTLTTLTRGTYLTGNNYNGGVATQWNVDATSTNTVSKIVARDANGDFAMRDLSARNVFATGAVVAHMTSNYSGITEPIAGTNILGFVKVDGTTITIDLDGTIHAIGSGAGSWNELSGKPADLVAIAALSGTSGLLKKTGVGTWTLDTNTYLQSSALDNYLALGGGTMSGTIIKTASNTIPAFRYMSPTNSSLGAFTIYDSTSNESLAFATLSNISTFKFICGTSGYVPPTVTISQFSPSFEITKDNAKVLGNVVWHAGNFNPTSFNAASATYASAVTLTADNSTNATNYPLFVNAATGNLSPRTDTGFTYNPSTGVLTTTKFSGNLSGNVTGGTISGTVGTFSSDFTVSGALRGNAGLELYHATPFIDFHYGNSTADYTSRIIENASGTLSIQANANVTGNMIASGAVVAHSTGSWTNTLPIASASILGTIIAGASLQVTSGGLLNTKLMHYTTTTGYTEFPVRDVTAEISIGTGSLADNQSISISLPFLPSSTSYGVTGNILLNDSTWAGTGLCVTFLKGSSNWTAFITNVSGAAVTRDNIRISISAKKTV